MLEFLISSRLERLAPIGYADPPSAANDGPLCVVDTFPMLKGDPTALPLRLSNENRALDITHWCDGSSRNPFKLFAGQQRSAAIAQQMLDDLKKLWKDRRTELQHDPLGLSVPLGGSSFKFDARKAWTAIDVGYSPDEQSHLVDASPVVELLAAIGLEHARPDEFDTRKVRYGVWKGFLPPTLARAALGGASVGVPLRIFRFTLALSGKNKNVTYAEEEVIL